MERFTAMMRFTIPLLSLAFFTAVSGNARQTVDRILVTVNDDAILESDIQQFHKKLKSKSYQELLGVDEKILANREAVLQLMVEEKLIDQQVKKLDLKATDQEVEGQIKAILKRNAISANQLESRLKQLGTSMADYREGLKRQIERRNLVEREIKPTLEVTEEQLRHFYLRNSSPTDAEVQYKIAHILIEQKAGKNSLDRAQAAYREVSERPNEFDKIVAEMSDDAETAPNGGVLGFFPANQLAKEFREKVTRAIPGTVLPPIKTSAGYHIIKVIEKVAGDFSKISKERKDTLRTQMVANEVEKKMGLWLERKKLESHIKRFAGASNGT